MVLMKRLSPFHGDIRYWRTAAFIFFVCAIGTTTYFIGQRANTNKIAIHKSCILLDNKVAEAIQTPPSNSTIILIDAILALIPPNKKQAFLEARANEPVGGGLTRINCSAVADHPEKIKATTQKGKP